MDYTPDVNLLRSMRAERFDPIVLASEATDNAFDADARTIVIDFAKERISFQDDGAGITRDRLAAMVKLGLHGEMATTQLGRFGIGIKHQAFNAGDYMTVDSTSRDGRVILDTDWNEMLRRRAWTGDDPQWISVLPNAATGTRIAISELRRSRPFDFDKMCAALAQRFHPALAAGRKIILNGKEVIAADEPAMSDIVDCEVPLSEGRSAHVRAGVLINDKTSPLYQVHVGYKHRVIMPRCSIGCDSIGGLSKMFARVALSGPWELSRFKDDLTDDEERDELDAALAVIFEPILAKCRSASMSANLDTMAEMLNAMLPPEMVPARPKRKKKPEPRPPKPPGPPSLRSTEDADPSPTGPVTKRKPRNQLVIDFDGRAADDGVGRFESGRPNRVHLSPDDPDIGSFLHYRDKEIGRRALYALAIVLLIQAAPGSTQLQLNLDFGRQISHLLSLQEFAKEEASA
jgi:hypothetical protein